MRLRSLAVAALAFALLGTPLCAQLAVGAVAPKVEPDKLINTEFRSLDELQGRLILYEFFAHW
jgi:hypothetical protein